MQFEYPLQWNPQISRSKRQYRSRFGSRSPSRAGIELEKELSLLSGTDIVISSNLKTKVDGGFYANQDRLEDSGICVYLKLKGEEKCFACDQWDIVADNIWALKLNVAAIRGMERWGGSNFMDGLFTGFRALPDPNDVITTSVQYFTDCTDKEQVRQRYKKLAKELHPDVGGDEKEFQEMKRQYEQRL